MGDPQNNPGYRLPLTLAPALQSGWNSVRLDPAVRRSLASYAAGPDDSLWAAGEQIGRYSFETGDFEPVFPVAALSLAPVSASECWAVAYGGGETSVVRASTQAGIETLPDLPDDDLPQQVTAGADETVFVFSFDRCWYGLQADRKGWSRIDAPGIEIQTIAAGSGDSVWLLGRQGHSCVLWQRDAATGNWTVVFESLPDDGDHALSAGLDGSVWLISRTGTATTILLFENDEWSPVELTASVRPRFDHRIVAGSAHRLFATVATPLGDEIQAFSVGVADRPATPWPDQSADERAAYEHISRQLGIVGGAGLRGEYDNRNQPFDSWRVDIHRMACPADIPAAAWEATVTLLLDELESVVAVNNLFRNLHALNTEIGIVNADILPGVERVVGLTHESPADERATIELVVGAMFQAALGLLYRQLPPPYHAVASILSAGIFAAIADTTRGDGADPNAVLKLRYANLTCEVADLYLRGNDANERMQSAILRDSGRLALAGHAIRSGLWPWPSRQTRDIAQVTAAAFERYFYRSLVPAKWQIVVWRDWWVNNTTRGPFPLRIEAPRHAALWECRGDPLGHQMCDVWICNALGAGIAAGESLAPHPDAALMAFLFETLEEDRDAFFKGMEGWSLTAVTGEPASARIAPPDLSSRMRSAAPETEDATPGAAAARFLHSVSRRGGA
jgi:hypothetical protein